MHRFEAKLLTLLKKQALPKTMKPVLSVSGGRDSVALLRSLAKVYKILDYNPLKVIYIHHGRSSSSEQQKYRDRAQQFVSNLCDELDLELLLASEPKDVLHTEEQFREHRQACYQKLLEQDSNCFFWLAQHQQDLLETRLIRLIRGTGPEGLQAMQLIDKNTVRPLLSFSSVEVYEYLSDLQQDWVEDPSNQSDDYFRNWIRNRWLVGLEEQRPGSINRMAKSLEQIAVALSASQNFDEMFGDKGIDRVKFRALSEGERKQVLAQYCLTQGIKNYTQGQFNELLKHLDREQKVFTLSMMKSRWSIDAKHITVLFTKQD